MINNFRDHAANERTYLAWVRTSVALMAFGFVIEKFDLFIRYLGEAKGLAGIKIQSAHAVGVGMALIGVGLVMNLLAAWSFLRNRRLIDAADKQSLGSALPNLALGAIVAVLGIFLIAYLSRELFN